MLVFIPWRIQQTGRWPFLAVLVLGVCLSVAVAALAIASRAASVREIAGLLQRTRWLVYTAIVVPMVTFGVLLVLGG